MPDRPKISLVKGAAPASLDPQPVIAPGLARPDDLQRRLAAVTAERDFERARTGDLRQEVIEAHNLRRVEKCKSAALTVQNRRLADAVGDAEKEAGDLREQCAALRDQLGFARAAEAGAKFRAEYLEYKAEGDAERTPGVSSPIRGFVICAAFGVFWATGAALGVWTIWGPF